MLGKKSAAKELTKLIPHKGMRMSIIEAVRSGRRGIICEDELDENGEPTKHEFTDSLKQLVRDYDDEIARN